MYPVEHFSSATKMSGEKTPYRTPEDMVFSGINDGLNSRLFKMRNVVFFTWFLIVVLFVSVIASSTMIYSKIDERTSSTFGPWYGEATEVTLWNDCAHNYSGEDWYTVQWPPRDTGGYSSPKHNISMTINTSLEALIESYTVASCFYNYTDEQWYTAQQHNPDTGYKCEALEPYKIIRVKVLQSGGSFLHCGSKDDCVRVITSYLSILEGYSKYAFFVDNSSNVYGGRSWECPYLPGQLWLGVLVDGFGPNTEPSERLRILHHVTDDMFRFGKCSGFLIENPVIQYVN